VTRDERAVLALLRKRLNKGRRTYGPLRLASERRDLVGEAVEELADAVLYLLMAVRNLRRRRTR
jgi:hypothetical protein